MFISVDDADARLLIAKYLRDAGVPFMDSGIGMGLGYTLDLERRSALVAWAHDNDAVILEDDYDSDLRYDQRPLEPMHHLDPDGRVVYVGTFSKILGPTLRMGYAVLPTTLVDAVVALRQATDGGPAAAIDGALATFLEAGHLDRHVHRTRRTYARRRQAVTAAVDRLLPRGTIESRSGAGLHLTLALPDAPPDDVIVQRAAANQLALATLRRTYQFTPPRPGIVLGFGALHDADIEPALTLLATSLI